MLKTNNITKYYGDLCAAEDISFEVEEEQFVTLLGPSGCGKSTLLHIIAGLRNPTNGEIFIRDQEMTETPPEQRKIGMVFQNTALFPHMTVEDNIRYGLELHDYDAGIETRINELLEMVQLTDHRDHKPNELSGGQKQRVALIRALAYEPDLLLLDEPLTGLDRVLREEMRREINRIQDEVGVTTLYVTHDQEEALSMSDKVIVLNDGSIEQVGTSEEIYTSPGSEFVAEFVGKSTRLEGTVTSTSPQKIDVDDIMITAPKNGAEPGEGVSIYVRPEDININNNSRECENEIPGTVSNVIELGNHAEIHVDIDPLNKTVIGESKGFTGYGVGDNVFVSFEPDEMIVL